ncbi:hypothetical protein LC605_21415 [Nostoc sp. CHAB 5836]|nr:hypothetical protein [Nostoc sp. CHAB 5836]MCC5617600.1 hypothetical protein [Nostoc sp. CHAB 5836]
MVLRSAIASGFRDVRSHLLRLMGKSAMSDDKPYGYAFIKIDGKVRSHTT